MIRGALRLGFVAVLAALTLLPPRAGAQAGPDSTQVPNDPTLAPIPAFVGYVNDRAGVLDEPTRAKLEAFLDQVEKKTGAEFAVLTVRTTAPEAPDQYKVRVFQAWKIGKADEDNGLLMLLALEERSLRFETGYGLEGVLPDGLESRIFRREMAPHFRNGDYAQGVIAGVLACASRIAAEKNVKLEWDGKELRYSGGRDGVSRATLTFIALAVIVLVIVLATLGSQQPPRGGRRRRGGWYVDPGGFGGWGGGFGGGFGGGGLGGGGFGGGGGSFGGFGGGASGGGGGGGSW